MRDQYSVEQRNGFYYIFYKNLLIVKTNCEPKIENFIQKDMDERKAQGDI